MPANFRLAIGNRFKENGKGDWGIKKAGRLNLPGLKVKR